MLQKNAAMMVAVIMMMVHLKVQIMLPSRGMKRMMKQTLLHHQ